MLAKLQRNELSNIEHMYKLTDSDDTQEKIDDYLKMRPYVVADFLQENPSIEYSKALCSYIDESTKSDKTWHYVDMVMMGAGVAASVALMVGTGGAAAPILYASLVVIASADIARSGYRISENINIINLQSQGLATGQANVAKAIESIDDAEFENKIEIASIVLEGAGIIGDTGSILTKSSKTVKNTKSSPYANHMIKKSDFKPISLGNGYYVKKIVDIDRDQINYIKWSTGIGPEGDILQLNARAKPKNIRPNANHMHLIESDLQTLATKHEIDKMGLRGKGDMWPNANHMDDIELVKLTDPKLLELGISTINKKFIKNYEKHLFEYFRMSNRTMDDDLIKLFRNKDLARLSELDPVVRQQVISRLNQLDSYVTFKFFKRDKNIYNTRKISMEEVEFLLNPNNDHLWNKWYFSDRMKDTKWYHMEKLVYNDKAMALYYAKYIEDLDLVDLVTQKAIIDEDAMNFLMHTKVELPEVDRALNKISNASHFDSNGDEYFHLYAEKSGANGARRLRKDTMESNAEIALFNSGDFSNSFEATARLIRHDDYVYNTIEKLIRANGAKSISETMASDYYAIKKSFELAKADGNESIDAVFSILVSFKEEGDILTTLKFIRDFEITPYPRIGKDFRSLKVIRIIGNHANSSNEDIAELASSLLKKIED